jgi:hypothetical protein
LIRLKQKGGDGLKRIKSRAKKSWVTRRRYDTLLDEVYQYVMPYRTAGIHKSGEGDKLTNKLFDSTGPEAAVKFTGRMQQEVTPPFQDFFSLGAGPLLKRGKKNTKKIDEDLAEVSQQVNAALTTSNFALASAEMYTDFFAGTGAMLMLAGDARQLIRNVAVPIGELALELGPYGDIWGRHWLKTYDAWMIEEMWPRGRFSDELKQQMRHEQDKPIELMQSTIWNPQSQLHELTVFRSASSANGATKDDEASIWDEGFRASPWITPRFWSVAGEALGRGPGMLMLPWVKTLNKTRELELQAAAMALFGIWTAVDDDVFNTATARFKPGTFWKVASNGGGRGPSLQKVDVPGRFDLSRIVAQEEREQINRIGFNRQLPPDTGAVRSPTEIMARIRDLDIDLGGVYGRVALEIVHPAAQRGVDILAGMKVLETNLTIDQLTVGLTVLSPIANSQKAAQAKKTVDYMQIVASLLGPDYLALTMRLEDSIPDLGRDIGVQEKHLRAEDGDKKAIREAIIERAAQIAAAEQMKQLGHNGGPPMDDQPVNGAALQ